MESRSFIKKANSLIEEIKDDVEREQGQYLQREVNQLFSGLQNPTLPSAGKLRDVALDAGLQIDQRVLQRIQQAENLWSF
jgi:hypothetical protein